MNPFDPMPTIKSILGMTMAQDIEQSIMLAELDDFETPQCEHAAHDADSDHHSGAAAYLMVTPCGHHEGYVCAPYSIWAQGKRFGRCPTCETWSDISAYTFTPIGIS